MDAGTHTHTRQACTAAAPPAGTTAMTPPAAIAIAIAIETAIAIAAAAVVVGIRAAGTSRAGAAAVFCTLD